MTKLAARGTVLGLWLLNMALWCALADAAIETARSLSPLWLAVAGAVVAYAAFLAVGWRWLDLVMKATGSLAVFAALLAFSGWRTGSLAAPGGVFALGHSADVAGAALLLALFVAVLAAVVIARSLSVWLRVACALVLAYAALPAVAALLHGDGLAAALRSNAFLPSDPFWLRGTFIGVAIVLPLTGLACLSIASLWAARGRYRVAVRLAASALVCALAAQVGGLEAATLGLPSLAAAEIPASSTVEQPSVPVSVAVSGHDEEAIAPAVVAEATRLGTDPSVLLGRVAKGIDPAVYDGAQQGAAGTLAAGAGNAADKALLLSALIRASDSSAQVRFATCELSPEQAAQLVSAAQTARPAHHKILFQDAGDLVANARDAVTRGVLERAATMWQVLRTQARTETSELADGLRQANADPAGPSRVRTESSSYAANHVWLQVLRNGAWIDLDPTITPAVAGHVRCNAASVSPALPPQLYATLTVRVKVENRAGTALQSSYALEKVLRIADLADANLGFAFAEPAGLTGATSQTPAPAGMRAYTPLLRVGDADTVGQPIFLPQIAVAREPLQTTAHGFDQVIGALNGPTPSAASSSPGPSPSDVTGAWLELALLTPSSPPETVESPLFDRIGFAARAAGTAATAPLAPLDEAAGEYVPLAAVWNIAVWTGSQVAGAGAAGDATVVQGADVPSLLRALGRLQVCYYLLREALLEDSTSVPASLVATRPSLSLLAFGFAPGTAGAVRSRTLIDVATDHTLALAAQDPDALTADASWAVTSLLAERALVRGSAVLLGKGRPDDIAHADNDVLGIFDSVRQAQVPLEFLQPADTSKAQTLAASPEAQARVAARLAAGDAVLVPARALPNSATENFGWWDVDPTNGSIHDEMQDGRHQETEEEAVVNKTMVDETSPIMKRFGRKIAAVIACAAFWIPFAAASTGEGAESSELAGQAGESLHAGSELGEQEEEMDECAEED